MCRLLLAMPLLWQCFHSASGGGANGFSPFDSLADVDSYTNNRQLLLPTLNFTCNGTIVAWSLALTSTISEDSPAGSIALQVWRNRSGAEGETECVEMVQEAIYSQVLGRDERVQLTLRDSRFFLNVSEGDFLGFFVYEEGLSPLYDRVSSNMTVLRSASQESLYCLINGTVSPAGRPTLNVSPMVTLELATLPVGVSGTPPAEPAVELSTPGYVVYTLGSLLGVVTLLLVGCVALGAGLLARRRSLHEQARSVTRSDDDVVVSLDEEDNLVQQSVVEEWLLSWKHATVSGCFAEDHYFKYYRGTLSGSGLPMAMRTGAGEDPLLHVSVKVVRDNKSEESLRVFWERVLLLKKVTSGNHCHVVQLVGCIVQELPAAILVEYSAEGNLLTYLRGGGAHHEKERERQHCPTHLKTCQEREEEALVFAQQIASGMEYLFSVGVASHALSCRTILMTHGKVLRVASFDASPDEKEAALKWAAPECIKGEESSEKSSMWSYGVTLLEICTRGRLPYGNLAREQRAARLTGGHGVARPRDCLPDLFELMLQCWREIPSERPSFVEMHRQTQHLRDLMDQRGYAPVFVTGQRLLASVGGGSVQGTAGGDGYMPTLVETMEPLHSYAVLVKGKPAPGGKEGRKAGPKGGKKAGPKGGRGVSDNEVHVA